MDLHDCHYDSIVIGKSDITIIYRFLILFVFRHIDIISNRKATCCLPLLNVLYIYYILCLVYVT